jgi:hypothetical protein
VAAAGRELGLKLHLDGARIYVTNFADVGRSVIVYAAGAKGNATPTATISGSNTERPAV